MTSPRVVLFDLGNVLVHIHPGAFLQTLGINNREVQSALQPKIIEIVQRFERGKDSTEGFLHRIERLMNSHSSFYPAEGEEFGKEELCKAMLKVIGEPVSGMEEIVKGVSASTRIGLLSNTNPLHYAYCVEYLPVLQRIPTHYLSYQLHCLKPERLIFEKVLRDLEVPAEGVIFIDDAEENVRAAAATGMKGIRFEGIDVLTDQLSRLRIL